MASLGVERGTSPALEVGRFRGWDTGDWLARPQAIGRGQSGCNRAIAKRCQSWLDVPCSMVSGATCSRYATVWVNFFASVLRNWHLTQHMDRAGCRWPGLGCRRCLAKSKSQWDLWLIPCNLLGEVPFYSTILWDDLGFIYIYIILYIYNLSWFIMIYRCTSPGFWCFQAMKTAAAAEAGRLYWCDQDGWDADSKGRTPSLTHSLRVWVMFGG